MATAFARGEEDACYFLGFHNKQIVGRGSNVTQVIDQIHNAS